MFFNSIVRTFRSRVKDCLNQNCFLLLWHHIFYCLYKNLNFLSFFYRSISAFILLLCVLGSITEIIYDYVKSRAKEDYMFYVDEEDEQFSNVVNHKDDNSMKENNRVNISMHTVNVEDEG